MPLTEIWLRLMAVASLNGEQMLLAVQCLQNNSVDPLSVLASVPFSPRQIKQFLEVSKADLDRSYRWLEQPGHALLTADMPQYPRE